MALIRSINMQTKKIFSVAYTIDGHYAKDKLMTCEWNQLPPGLYIIETYQDNIPIDDETVEKF